MLLTAFRISVALMVFLSAMASFDFVWNLADVLMGFMATLNIIAILTMGNTTLELLGDYQRQRQKVKQLHFDPQSVGLKNCPYWGKMIDKEPKAHQQR